MLGSKSSHQPSSSTANRTTWLVRIHRWTSEAVCSTLIVIWLRFLLRKAATADQRLSNLNAAGHSHPLHEIEEQYDSNAKRLDVMMMTMLEHDGVKILLFGVADLPTDFEKGA